VSQKPKFSSVERLLVTKAAISNLRYLASLIPTPMFVRNEIFGPVAVIDTYIDGGDAVRRANDTDYGLGATLYTKDLSTAMRVSNQLEAETVTVNNSMYVHQAVAFGGWKSE
jgi:acyl-CoA reductase-like NAD-dependent aldehyde dehydrogenase